MAYPSLFGQSRLKPVLVSPLVAKVGLKKKIKESQTIFQKNKDLAQDI